MPSSFASRLGFGCVGFLAAAAAVVGCSGADAASAEDPASAGAAVIVTSHPHKDDTWLQVFLGASDFSKVQISGNDGHLYINVPPKLMTFGNRDYAIGDVTSNGATAHLASASVAAPTLKFADGVLHVSTTMSGSVDLTIAIPVYPFGHVYVHPTVAVSNGLASFDIATDTSGNFVASNVVTSMDVDVSGCGALGWCSFIAQIQLDLIKQGLATNGLVNALAHLLGDPSSIDPSHSAAQIAVRDFLNSTDYEKTILPGESQRSVDVSSIRLGAIPSWPGHTGFYYTETQVRPPNAPTCSFGALCGRGVSAACGTLQDTLQVEFDNPALSVVNRTAATVNGGVESFAMTVLGTPSAVNVRGCQQGVAASSSDPNADRVCGPWQSVSLLTYACTSGNPTGGTPVCFKDPFGHVRCTVPAVANPGGGPGPLD